METEMFQGVPTLIKVYTDPLPEYDKWNFSRGPPTDISFTLGTTQLYGINNSIKFSFFLSVDSHCHESRNAVLSFFLFYDFRNF